MEKDSIKSLKDLSEAFKAGKLLGARLTLDNDTTHVYVGSDADSVRVFEMHPAQLMEEALALLGVPWEDA